MARMLSARGAIAGLASLLFGTAALAAADTPNCQGPLVYFASSAGGPAAGIESARFDSASGRLCPLGLAATVDTPTWLVADPARPILYATSETRGAVRGVWSFRIDPRGGGLALLGHVDAGGAEPTFLALDARSRTLFATHWGSGEVAALPLGADGAAGAPVAVQRATGSGPKPGQNGPRAHAAALDPAGKMLAVADFGSDRLSLYRFDDAARQLAPADPPSVQLPPGSGPRHLVFDRGGRFLYLVDQLSSDVRVLRWDGGAAPTLVQALSTLGAGYGGANNAAEIALSGDGRFLYVSNRGEDTIVVYAVDGATGRLTESQRESSGGKTPRSFALDPSGRWLLVANQGSDAVTVFARDPRTGMVRRSATSLPVAAAAGIAFGPVATR